MPVSGLPDPEKHWRCVGCEQWFEADEGRLHEQQRMSYAGRIADGIRGGGKMRFRCDPCSARYNRNRVILWTVCGAIFLFALIRNL